jgi:hypothetical protein
MAESRPRHRPSEPELAELLDAAKRVAGFAFEPEAETATAANVAGVRSGPLTFSRRRDSRTLFATDDRQGHGRKLGAWTGEDDRLERACVQALRAARVKTAEIAGVDVLREFGATAERVADDEYRIEDAELIQKIARARRVLEDTPVWSSSCSIALTARGRLGRLELHWPEVPAAAVREARRLRGLVAEGFEPPHLDGAEPESIEAGIAHSPAIALFMDVVPAIRVVYALDTPGLGRKPVLFLDRHSELVALPRDIKPPPRNDAPRGKPSRGRRAPSARG